MSITFDLPTNTAGQPQVFPSGPDAADTEASLTEAFLTESELAAQLVGDARQVRVLTGD